VTRLLGRNRLVRNSDRWETFTVALAVIAVIVAVPVAATFGTAVKDALSSTYVLQQAVGRHEATAQALANARLHLKLNDKTFDVNARWSAEDGSRVCTMVVPNMVHAGDRFDIWVDGRGDYVDAPVPASRAATTAAGWAALSWIAVTAAVAAGVGALRRSLEHVGYAA
jgi:hypothetical protein